MQKVTRNITVDLSRKSSTRVVFATQNDLYSRKLLIALTDDGKPYAASKSLTVTVNFKCADESRWSYLADVLDDGRIEHTVSPNVLAVEGLTQATVSLFDKSGSKLTSSPFVIEVAATLYPESELSDEAKLSYVDEMIAKFANFHDNENQRIDAEQERKTNEYYRNNAEAARVIAEHVRDGKMYELDVAEQQREINEQKRYENENGRKFAESSRAYAEQQRAANEAAREAVFGDLESALDAIIEIQNALMGGGV